MAVRRAGIAVPLVLVDSVSHPRCGLGYAASSGLDLSILHLWLVASGNCSDSVGTSVRLNRIADLESSPGL